tara:strand:- start:364 stop:549 length:186 start_codon:yes stop_codon:yes gene_type:complete
VRAVELKNTRMSGTHSNNSRVDLNDLIQKVREEEKKSKRSNLIVSAAVISIIAVFGIILTI